MADPKILKYDAGVVREVQNFKVQDLKNPGPLVYQTPSLRASAAAQGQKERRFHYDPLLKDVLSSDEETEELINARVAERIAALRAETLESAREEGYRDGYTAGENEAHEKFEVRTNEAVAELNQLIEAIEGQKSEIYRAQGEFLQELSIRFAEVILQKEITADPTYLRRLVTDIVEKVGARERVKVIVHPSQLAQLSLLAPELEKKITTLRSVSFETSDALEPTDCVVETDFNRIDASLETQLQTLRERLEAKS